MILKIIMSAQFLKVAQTGSYDVDETSYLGDLMTPGPENDHLQSDNSSIVDVVPLSGSVTISHDEKNALYYVAGYCLNSLRKRRMTCEDCFSSASTTAEIPGIGDLVSLKDYTREALCRVSQAGFDAILKWEMVFRVNVPALKKK